MRIGARGQQAPRLVVEKEPRAFAGRQWLVIDADAVMRAVTLSAGDWDHRAIDGDSPRGHPFLRLAARGKPRPCDHLGDALAGLVAALVLVVHLRFDVVMAGLVPAICVCIHRGV